MRSADSLLVLLLLFVASNCVTAQAAARKVNVSSSSELLKALQSDADVLVLQNDVAVGPEFEQFEGAPLPLQRCARLLPAGSSRACLRTALARCMVTVICMFSSCQWQRASAAQTHSMLPTLHEACTRSYQYPGVHDVHHFESP